MKEKQGRLNNVLLQQETIVDSRFKLLVANFQKQIDYLKGKFVKQSKTVNKEVFESQDVHVIKKRKTKPSPTKPPRKFANMNSSCTFFYADYPDAGHGKSKNATFEILKAGKEVIKKQENNRSKSIKPICENSTPLCTFFHPDNNRAGRVNSKNSTTLATLATDQTGQDPTDVNKTPINGIDPFLRDIEALKKQGGDQSKRIDQLERKLAMLQNTSPISSVLTRGNIKGKMKNGASQNNGQDSKASTPPSSCKELAMLGHYLDGLYLGKNKETKKIKTVFCKFSDENKGRMSKFVSLALYLFVTEVNKSIYSRFMESFETTGGGVINRGFLLAVYVYSRKSIQIKCVSIRRVSHSFY